MAMQREEWDWPPRRRRYRRYRTRFDVYEPRGWSSPLTTRIVRIYWRTMVTAIKMLLAIPLAIVAIGSFWLFGVIVWIWFWPVR
jgi:hypothetical protein